MESGRVRGALRSRLPPSYIEVTCNYRNILKINSTITFLEQNFVSIRGVWVMLRDAKEISFAMKNGALLWRMTWIWFIKKLWIVTWECIPYEYTSNTLILRYKVRGYSRLFQHVLHAMWHFQSLGRVNNPQILHLVMILSRCRSDKGEAIGRHATLHTIRVKHTHTHTHIFLMSTRDRPIVINEMGPT